MRVLNSHPPLHAVVFDYGHTLLDFALAEDALLDAYEQVLEMLRAEAYNDLPTASRLVDGVSRRIDAEIQESYRQRSLDEMDIVRLFQAALDSFGLDLPATMLKQIAILEHRAMASRMTVPEENLAVLAGLRERGLKIGLVSNAHFLPEMMREDIGRLGVAPYLNDAVFSSEVGVRKPHPDIYRKVLSEMGVEPQSAMFVGDRLADDIAGASALGMRTVLTREYRHEEVVDAGPQPDYVIDRLPDLLPIVDGLRA